MINLFDSIVSGYPIGNLLLWRRPALASENLTIGALHIDAPKLDQALYVVDGQQRLTSLANAVTDAGHADPRFALAYDVAKDSFVPSKAGGTNPAEIPLPVIFDLSRLLRWYSDNPELSADPVLIERSNGVAKRIREFRVPVYVVDQTDPAVLRDIFDRMNNYGKQLTRAEVFSALHETGSSEAGEHTGTTDLTAIAENLHAFTGYGVVDDNTILLASLARRSPDISRDIRREFSGTQSEFPGESAQESQQRTQQALVDAVRFLQEEASAPHFAFLPYRYLLVVLARFFAHFPTPSAGSRRNLRRWFWRAATLGPELTRGNITYATRSLCARIVPGDERGSVQGLLDMLGDRDRGVPVVEEFRTNYAETRLMVAALWARRPRSLSSHEEYTLDDLLSALGEGNTAAQQAVQLFRSTALDARLRSLAGNRVILAEAPGAIPENPAAVLRSMSGGFEDINTKAVLESHFIEEESAFFLAADEVENFLASRQEVLKRALREFLSRQAEWDFEDTPSLRDLEIDDPPRDDELDVGDR